MRPFLTLVMTMALVVVTGRASAQTTAGPDSTTDPVIEVLVLGVWHMANIRSGSDDILASARQEELSELLDALALFEPTKVALEQAFYREDSLNLLYERYLKGEHVLTRNERQQLGFRLAERLGHQKVYAIDADGDYPQMTLEDYVQARGHAERYEEMSTRHRALWTRFDEYRSAHTLLESLLYINTDGFESGLMTHEYERASFGEPWNWAGPDLLADSFQRNIRIHGNIVHLAGSAGDRVLVVIGVGHLAWLRHGLRADPRIRLRTLQEFAR